MSGARWHIAREHPDQPDIARLLASHLAEMRAASPPELAHALPAAQLATPDITFLAARCNGELAAIGALRRLDATTGEIKSMRAAPRFRGQGAGRAVLLALLEEASAQGLSRVGLETGTGAVFEDAWRLYLRTGFVPCAQFGPYRTGSFTRCMQLELPAPSA